MGKVSKADKETLTEASVRDAKALKHYHARWIEKREMLRALINRAEKLTKVIQDRLDPLIAQEVDGELDSRCVVRVGRRIVDVQLVKSDRPNWKDLATALVKADVLEMSLPGFTKTVESARAKILGQVSDIVDELDREPPETSKLTVEPAKAVKIIKEVAKATGVEW
jgi:hypothetical protein